MVRGFDSQAAEAKKVQPLEPLASGLEASAVGSSTPLESDHRRMKDLASRFDSSPVEGVSCSTRESIEWLPSLWREGQGESWL